MTIADLAEKILQAKGEACHAILNYMIDHVDDEATARRLLNAYAGYVERARDQSDTDAAMDIAKSNLAYLAGYRDHDTRLRVERLYNCVHPVIGPASERRPTQEEMFELGKKWAEGSLNKFEQPNDV